MDSPSVTSRFRRERVLITVKTYPTPHARHHESVCTAGINEAGEWRRLWPIPFRFLEKERQFRRYEWIEVDIRKQTGDPRRESHVVDPDSIRRAGDFVRAGRHWQARRNLLVPHAVASIEHLQDLLHADGTSMGFLRPKTYHDLKLSWHKESKWSPLQAAQTRQQTLLASARPLEELPFRLKLHYTCDDKRCRDHKQNITDWEVGALFFKLQASGRDIRAAAEETRDVFARFFTDSHDTWLFVGTLGPVKPTFIVTGAFYPKAERQARLFE